MDPLMPDWRTFGAGPEGGNGTGTRVEPTRRVFSTPVLVGIALVLAGVLFAVIAGVLALAPDPRSIVMDLGTAGGRQTVGAPAAAMLHGLGSTTDSAATAQPSRIVVDVAGAVGRPGLVTVSAGSRVGDAIRLAGGFGPRADLTASASDLNLAAILVDGAKVLVPAIGDDQPPEQGPSAGGDDRIDVNTASQTELEELPGIGPVTASRIIESRTQEPFATVDELRGREVIGQATFDKIRDLVTAGR
jgi:competence protein ComEA